MANSQPFRTTPQLGPQLDDVFTEIPYWDATGNITEPSYKLLNKETGNDGADYIWVKAGSSNIAATASTGTQVQIDADGEATAGSGGWYAPVDGVPAGAYFHARSKPWNVR